MIDLETPPKPIKLESPNRVDRIPVSMECIFTFPEGIPAFEEYHQFILYCVDDMQPFFFMKSVGITPEISFVCVDPFLIKPNYEVRISRADQKSLGIQTMEDCFLFSTVTVAENPQDTTANLQGPIVINLRTNVGKQVICEGADVRYRIWDILNKLEECPGAPVDVK